MNTRLRLWSYTPHTYSDGGYSTRVYYAVVQRDVPNYGQCIFTIPTIHLQSFEATFWNT